MDGDLPVDASLVKQLVMYVYMCSSVSLPISKALSDGALEAEIQKFSLAPVNCFYFSCPCLCNVLF